MKWQHNLVFQIKNHKWHRRISYFMYGERITKQAVIGTVMAFVGMVLLFV